MKKCIGLYVRTYPEAALGALSKSMIVSATQQPDGKAMLPSLGIAGAAGIGASLLSPEVRIVNSLPRMGEEFAILMGTHAQTHEGALAGLEHPGNLTKPQAEDAGKRLFMASKSLFEKKIYTLRAKATLGGLGAVHATNIIGAESLQKGLSHFAELGFSATTAYGLYHIIRKVKDGKSAEEYDNMQSKLHEAHDDAKKNLSSQEGKGARVPIEPIRKLREVIVERLHKSALKVNVPFEVSTGALMGTAVLFNEFSIGSINMATAMVSAIAMINALRPLNSNFTWARNQREYLEAREKLQHFIDAINISSYHIPNAAEEEEARENRGVLKIETRDEAFSLTAGKPLVARYVDPGSRIRTNGIAGDISIAPGTVNFLLGPPGTGKTTLAKMLLHEVGVVESKTNYDVSRGIDLIQIPSELGVLGYSNIGSSGGDQQIGKQIVPFILGQEDNIFKRRLKGMRQIHNQEMVFYYMRGGNDSGFEGEGNNGREEMDGVLDILLSNNPQKEEWVHKWAAHPANGENSRDFAQEDKLASALLTVATRNYFHPLFGEVVTPQDAAAYLVSIPGVGTSAGQGSFWKFRKLFTPRYVVAVADELTAHVGGRGRNDNSPRHMAHILMDYLRTFPEAIIIAIDHQDEVRTEIIQESNLAVSQGKPAIVDKDILPAARFHNYVMWQGFKASLDNSLFSA